MMLHIKIASRVVEIHPIYKETFVFLKNYAISVRDSSEISQVIFVTPERLEQEEKRLVIYRSTERFYKGYNPRYLELSYIYREISSISPKFNTFLMHGTVIGYKGLAYIITAPSGTGKTTRAQIWLQEFPGSYIINGDKPLLRMTEKEFVAYGTPWCGKEGWNTNTMLPIKAIYLLERTPNNGCDRIEKISMKEAFPQLLYQTYTPADPDLMQKTIQMLRRIEEHVSLFRFRSSPTPEAIHLAYEAACIG